MRIVPHLSLDLSVYARLDISDLDVPNKENLEHLTLFPVGSYTKLVKIRHKHKPLQEDIKDDIWDMVYASVNRFINTLPSAEQITIAQGFMLIHNTVLEFFKSNPDMLQFNSMLRQVGAQLNELEEELDLCTKLRAYIDENIVVGLYEGAGKRAQDSEALTFQPEQVRDVMTITLLCKMLSPIYGCILNAMDKHIDTNMKVPLAVTILTTLFNRRYPALIEKLYNYIKHTIIQNNDESTSGYMHGYDNNSITYAMYSALMIRQLVNIDLRIQNGNLMTYILVSVKRAIATVRSGIKKDPTYSRKPIQTRHEEDGNTAQLEIDSMTSRKTLDVGPIIVASINPTIKTLMVKYQIDDAAYQESLEFYQRNPIIPNPINQDINSMIFGRHIGGGAGLRMLRSVEYTKLTTLAQLIIFSIDVNYYELGHMVTARMADTAVDTTINPSLFKVKVGSSQAYRTIKQNFEDSPFGFKGKDWDHHVQKIVENLTTNKYVLNTSNFLWNWLDEDNMNGKVFSPTDATITAICSLYEFILQTEGTL